MVVTHACTRQKCLTYRYKKIVLEGANTMNHLQHICKELITLCDIMKLFLFYKEETVV